MWMKDDKPYNGSSIISNGMRIFNPSDEQLAAAGYIWVEPPVDNHNWVDKELFVNAAYALVPAEAITSVLADAETAKGAVAGMVLLTTAAAPGNMIDANDPRVEQWLSVGGVTVEQVLNKMMEI